MATYNFGQQFELGVNDYHIKLHVLDDNGSSHGFVGDYKNNPWRSSRRRGGRRARKGFHEIYDEYMVHTNLHGSNQSQLIRGAQAIRVKAIKGKKTSNPFYIEHLVPENMYGYGGNDWLFGYGGNDNLFGGQGNDVLDGGWGNDNLYGGNNNDLFLASTGFDTIDGGEGIDTVSYLYSYINEHGLIPYQADYDKLLKTMGSEYTQHLSSGLQYYERSHSMNLNGIKRNPKGITVQGSNKNVYQVTTDFVVPTDGFSWGGPLKEQTYTATLRGIEQILGTRYVDTMNGSSGDDIFYGHLGNDILNGNGGHDRLYGDAGNDIIDGGLGNDLLYSGDLTSGASDSLTGNAGADTFFLGHSKTQDLSTGNSVDWKKSGFSIAGDVAGLFFSVLPGFGKIGKIASKVIPMVSQITQDISNRGNVVAPSTGPGSVTIEDFNPSEDVIFIPLPASGSIDTDIDTSGDNILQVKHDENSTDVIATVKLSSEVLNLKGNNSVKDLQKDWYSIIESNAVVIDSNKAKFLRDLNTNTKISVAANTLKNLGNSRFLVLGAYSGVDIEGGNGSDYLYGTQFGDVISGYQGSDSDSDGSSDTFYGFSGNDEFLIGKGSDDVFGGDGFDTVNFKHAKGAVKVDLSKNKVIDDGFGTQDDLNLIEGVIGSKHNDIFTGDDKNNLFKGGQGSDTINISGGFDILIGDAGNDKAVFTLPEILIPYLDISTVNKGKTDLTVKGLNIHVNLGSIEQFVFKESNQNTVTLDRRELLARGKTLDKKLTGNGFNNTLIGGNKNDRLTGGSGKDNLVGGGGDDFLHGGKDGSADKLAGGAGADIFFFDFNTIFLRDHIKDFQTGVDKIVIDGSAYGITNIGQVSTRFEKRPFQKKQHVLYAGGSRVAILATGGTVAIDVNADVVII